MSRPIGVSFLGVWYILEGLSLLGLAVGFGYVAGMLAQIFPALGQFTGMIVLVVVFAAVIEFTIAGALFSGRKWGRRIVIVLAIVDLTLQLIIVFTNPLVIGFIVIDLIVLFYMWRPHVIQYFKGKTDYSKCVYCNYLAEDDKDLHNHHVTCEKKKEYHSKKANLQTLQNNHANPNENDDLKNLGILKNRLAKGEITKQEYDELKGEFQ